MNDAALSRLAARVGRALLRAGLRVATAESCTAGWIAKALTDTAGSSRWLDSGYVTYSNQAKVRALGVSLRTLERFGAVSEQTVREMARGALGASGVEVAVAVTGIAGPDGGTPGKPVGTVWFCVARRRGRRIKVTTARSRFRGDREAVRRSSVVRALRLLAKQLR
jgi:nicotinamide-nucleotide amidase